MPTRVRVVNEMRSSCRSAMSMGKKTTALNRVRVRVRIRVRVRVRARVRTRNISEEDHHPSCP